MPGRSYKPARASYENVRHWREEPPPQRATLYGREEEEEREPKTWEIFLNSLKDREIQKILMALGAGIILLFIIEGIVKITCLVLKSKSMNAGGVVKIGGLDYVPFI